MKKEKETTYDTRVRAVKAVLNNNPVSTVAKMYNVIVGLKNITRVKFLNILKKNQ